MVDCFIYRCFHSNFYVFLTFRKKVSEIRECSLRNLRKFQHLRDVGLLTLFRKNCWNSGEFSSKFVNFGQLLGKNQWNFKNKTAKMQKKFDEIWLNFWMRSSGCLPEALFMVFQLDYKGAEVCDPCRSRQELSNKYLLANIGFDTAENEPPKVFQTSAKS